MIMRLKERLKSKYFTLKRIVQAKRLKKDKTLVIIFVMDIDIVNGGLLSLNSIYNYIKNERSDYQVITSFIKIRKVENFLKYSQFENNLLISTINLTSAKIINFKKVVFFIPEMYIEQFNTISAFYKSQPKKNIFNSTKQISANILNQNEMLMPNESEIEKLKAHYPNLSISVAHIKYLEANKKFNLPVFHLPAWLNTRNKYECLPYKNKKNIIAISPDDMDYFEEVRSQTKDDLISRLQKNFPSFEVIVIEKLIYKEYKKLMLNTKYLITLGEGLDGYFMESAMSGAVPFAIKNDVFFPKEYLDLPNLFNSFDDLFNKIVSTINHLEKNENIFNDYNLKPKKLLTKDYNYLNYSDKLDQLLDFHS